MGLLLAGGCGSGVGVARHNTIQLQLSTWCPKAREALIHRLTRFNLVRSLYIPVAGGDDEGLLGLLGLWLFVWSSPGLPPGLAWRSSRCHRGCTYFAIVTLVLCGVFIIHVGDGSYGSRERPMVTP